MKRIVTIAVLGLSLSGIAANAQAGGVGKGLVKVADQACESLKDAKERGCRSAADFEKWIHELPKCRHWMADLDEWVRKPKCRLKYR